MENWLNRLSSYNILSYLIPGVLFLLLLDTSEIVPFDKSNFLLILFCGYFAGMVLSRIGSVVIEPWFKKWKIVKYAEYNDFLKAEQTDPKIQTLLSESNMSRTFVALFLLLLLLYGVCLVDAIKEWLRTPMAIYILLFILLILFVFSYRKQSSFIRKRVEHIIKKKS